MNQPTEPEVYSVDQEWKTVLVYMPRYALRAGRHGVRARMIWPGKYEVRWSRTHECKVYRRY